MRPRGLRRPAVLATVLMAVLVAIGTVTGGVAEGAEGRLVVETTPSPLAPRSAWLRLEADPGAFSESDSETKYLWQCGEGLPRVETTRAQRGCRYDRPGRYRPSVVVRRTDRDDVAVRARDEIAVAPRPPLTLAIDATPSNRWWRVPVTVSAAVRVTGLPEDETVEDIAWLLDEAPIAAARQTIRAALSDPGAHRLTAIVRTSARTATATRVVDARANQPPRCAIEQAVAEPPAPPATVRLTARCEDADGTVVAYDWRFPDGQTAGGGTVEWTAQQAGRHVVRLTARDDAGAQTAVDATVEWSH